MLRLASEIAVLLVASPVAAVEADTAALLDARATRVVPDAERPRALALVPPGVELFYALATNHVDTARPIPDGTGDGRDEILYGIRQSNVPNVFLLDGASSGAATVVWSFMTTGGVSNGYPTRADQSIVPSSDTDGNGAANFLLGTEGGGRVAYAFDSLAHAELWRFDTYTQPDSGWVYSLAEMSDTTGDGVPEVAFGAGSFADSLWMVDGASSGVATVLWTWAAPDAVGSVRNLGDVNGDGKDDVLAESGDTTGHQVVALDGDPPTSAASILWPYSTGGVNIWSLAVLPDTNSDGVDEALAAIWTTAGSAVRCLDGATGTLLWASTTVFGYGMQLDPLPDVTGDGIAEVVVGSWENAVQVLDGATGAALWKRSVGTLNGGDVWTARAVGDLNGDGFADVVAGSFDTYVYAYSGVNGYPFWSFATGRRVYTVHGVGDLNGDGVGEIAVGNQNLAGTPQPVVHVLDGDAGLALPLFADDFENGAPVGWTSQVGRS